MGNRASISIHLDDRCRSFIARVKIILTLCCSVHQAGQSLTGRVVFQVKKPIRKGRRLELLVEGKEKIGSGGISRTGGNETGSSRLERSIFRVDVVLERLPDITVPGVYAYPFRVSLPASLPSSTVYSSSGDSSRNIVSNITGNGFGVQYKVKAGLIGAPGLRDEIPLTITSAPLPDEVVSHMVQPQAFDVRAAAMIKTGQVVVGASVRDSHVGRGEAIELHLACRNESTSNIQRVSIKFVEDLEWVVRYNNNNNDNTGQKKQKEEHKTRQAQIVQQHLPDVDLPGLEKERKTRGDLKIRRGNSQSRSICFQEIYEQLLTGNNIVHIPVPHGIRDSYSGKLVTISHRLQVKLKTGKLVSNAVLTIPLRIGRKNMPPKPDLPTASATLCATQQSNVATDTNERVNIPLASAIILPADTVYGPLATDTDDESVVVLGGEAVMRPESPVPSAPPSMLDDIDPLPPPVAPGFNESDTCSLGQLFVEMGLCVNDFDMLKEKVNLEHWQRLFSEISPDDFGDIIVRVNDEFDQARVAELLAPYVSGGLDSPFTCLYAARAVRSTSEWNRISMVERLLPLCSDIQSQHPVILRELSEWDRTVTETHFREAVGETLWNSTATAPDFSELSLARPV